MQAQQLAVNSRPSVLVVDDEESVLVDVKAYLNTYGFRVDTTLDLEEAEALLTTERYSLVIIDRDLTGKYGREGLGLLRVARTECPGAKRLLMTEFGAQESEPALGDQGADAILEKPLLLSEVATVGMRLIGMRIPALLGPDG